MSYVLPVSRATLFALTRSASAAPAVPEHGQLRFAEFLTAYQAYDRSRIATRFSTFTSFCKRDVAFHRALTNPN